MKLLPKLVLASLILRQWNHLPCLPPSAISSTASWALLPMPESFSKTASWLLDAGVGEDGVVHQRAAPWLSGPTSLPVTFGWPSKLRPRSATITACPGEWPVLWTQIDVVLWFDMSGISSPSGSGSVEEAVDTCRLQRNTLLREIAIKTGIQVFQIGLNNKI